MTAQLADRIRHTSAADLISVYEQAETSGFFNLLTALVALYGLDARRRTRYVAVWDLVQRMQCDGRFELRLSGGPGMFSYRVLSKGLFDE